MCRGHFFGKTRWVAGSGAGILVLFTSKCFFLLNRFESNPLRATSAVRSLSSDGGPRSFPRKVVVESLVLINYTRPYVIIGT